MTDDSPKTTPPQLAHSDVPIHPGPFEPTWESLAAGYSCPEWFRDAKFGIWAHWGPQTVGESGDWYARFLYLQDNHVGDDPYQRGAYESHLAKFGHPSDVGYKDLLPLWQAGKWDPKALMSLYKDAGAKFFVSMGAHHDNFDLWQSDHQPWNACNIGPKRDVVGEWKAAADEADLKFGVSFHADYAWWWWQAAFGSDDTGPRAGEPYDAAQHLDGKGTWWEGLELEDLYGKDLKDEIEDPAAAKKVMFHGTPELFKDTQYAEQYARKWLLRAKDIVDKYDPDWMYFDGNTYPFSGFGTGRGVRSDATQRFMAHYYNLFIERHGTLGAAMILKGTGWPKTAAIEDLECVFASETRPEPWQMDNTIGDWFHRPEMTYSAKAVVHELLEVVCRNGTFLLGVPMLADGTLEAGAEEALRGVGEWLRVNGDGIYGTRPWRIASEGTNVLPFGKLTAQQLMDFTPQDIRFTTKNNVLYAHVMAWPDNGQVLVRSLASIPDGAVTRVRLLGSDDSLSWAQTAEGLVVSLPTKRPCRHAYTLQIDGSVAG